MRKGTLIAVFGMAALLLVGGLALSASHQMFAASTTPVQTTAAVQANANVTNATAAASETEAPESATESKSKTEAPDSAAESESKTEAPDSATDTDNTQQKDGPDGPQDGPQD